MRKRVDDAAEVVCPRCNVAYPEGERHSCAWRWSTVLWCFGMALGLTLCLVGGVAGWVWWVLAQGSFDHYPFTAITIVCLGSGLLILVSLGLAGRRK